MADASSRIGNAALQLGATYRVTGFVGQRATRSGALDGYRIWVRDAGGRRCRRRPRRRLPGATPVPGRPRLAPRRSQPSRSRERSRSPTARSPSMRPSPRPRRFSTRAADGSSSRTPRLLSSCCCRRVRLRRRSGSRIHAEGRIGVAYGAPRLRVDRFTVAGSGPVPAPLVLHAQPAAAHEWRLVSVTGQVLSVHKLGDRWRAEIAVGKDRVVVVGQPGAGIASTTLVEGRARRSSGIARRPAPTASDHRFAVTPRFPADVHVSADSQDPGSQPAPSRMRPANGSTTTDPRAARPTPPRQRPSDADLDGPRAVRRQAGPRRRPRRRPAARTASRSMTGPRSAGSCSAAPLSSSCR